MKIKADASADAAYPRVATHLLQGFAAYSRHYVRRHFHSIRILKNGLPPPDISCPVVIYLNHASWWDPLRMSAFLEQSGAALASGVPRQEMRTFSERLLIPLIHYVLLGFLPINRMRASRDPVFGTGCGQLLVARREAYHNSGGHSVIRATLHDGLKLARVFRAAGFATDLFDATCIAECRMYSTNAEVWRGLARNAHEGLGSPRLIGPATLLLLGGQILPICLLFVVCLQTPVYWRSLFPSPAQLPHFFRASWPSCGLDNHLEAHFYIHLASALC
jgi:hypothetical protein